MIELKGLPAHTPPAVPSKPIIVAVEGANDFHFLAALADQLRPELPEVPDLRGLTTSGCIVILPLGGGDAASWPDRFSSLGCREFHLYDREQQPETDNRIRAVQRVNARSGCRGFLTRKRALENYLHPGAVVTPDEGEFAFGDHDSVPLLLAQRWYRSYSPVGTWTALPSRSQRRQLNQAKRWLNTVAVKRMTAALLADRDPQGEVRGWFRTIAETIRIGGIALDSSASESRH